MIKNNQKYINLFQYLLDISVVICSLLLSYWLRFSFLGISPEIDHLTIKEYIGFLPYIILIFIFTNTFMGLYKPHRNEEFFREFISVVKSNLIAVAIILSILFIQKEIHYSRWVIVIFVCLTTLLMTLERGFIRQILKWLRSKGYNLKHILIIGANELGFEFAKKIVERPQWGYNIIGFIDNQRKGQVYKGFLVLNKINNLENIILNHAIDEIVIALNLAEYDEVPKIIYLCEKHGIKAQIIPAYKSFLPAKPHIDLLDEIPLINIRHIPLDEPLNGLSKRLFDIVFSLVVIIATSPVMLLISLIIKLTSPGGIIFKQERVGANKKIFMMYKFRSMHIQRDEEEKVTWTIENDPRKTKFGSFLRKTSLDELPQFFNVLFGQMSVIGPRPERPYFVEKFRDEIPKYMVKHHVKPGITGWAQINGWRGDTSIRKRIEHDIYYIENWTIELDVKIIFKTILNGFFNKNAY